VEVPEDLQRPETSAGDGLDQGTIVFDVIGTLFSTRVAARAFEELGMPAHAFDTSFAEALRDAFALSLAGGYAPLADVLEASLRRSLERQGLAGSDPAPVLAAMKQLDPFAGASEAVRMLSDAGLRLVTLTNGAAGSTRALLERAGVADRFHALLSCDEVRVSKPHPKMYALGRRDAGREAWLVASHAWDVQGAARAGFRTAWISTLEKRYLDAYPKPDVQSEDLRSAAEAILARLAA
jgi:2-haloacid dehalogenase